MLLWIVMDCFLYCVYHLAYVYTCLDRHLHVPFAIQKLFVRKTDLYVDGSSEIEITVFPLGMILAKGPSKDR